MKFHIEVSYWGKGYTKECRVVPLSGWYEAAKYAQAMQADINGHVVDIWLISDKDWCDNNWDAGRHFTPTTLTMSLRMQATRRRGSPE